MWLLSLELDNQGLDLSRQLVGIAYRAFGAVTQRLKPVLLVTVKDLVTGLARNAELPAHIRHRLPVQQTSDKAQTLFHHRTRFPRHRHLPRNKSGKCNPCVRYVLSPMSRAAHDFVRQTTISCDFVLSLAAVPTSSATACWPPALRSADGTRLLSIARHFVGAFHGVPGARSA